MEGEQPSVEESINRQFLRHAAAMLPSPLDLVQAYLLAQDHGLPTRLLDWTPNPLMALFVSVVERPQEDGEVIALAVDWRMGFGEGPQNPRESALALSERDLLVMAVIRHLFGQGPPPDRCNVLPIRPDLRSDQMFQQDACFTLHLPGSGPIQEREGNSCRYCIPSATKRKLLRELTAIGVNWGTLFRDLDHVSRPIRMAWDLDL